jgi:hypothetical protein
MVIQVMVLRNIARPKAGALNLCALPHEAFRIIPQVGRWDDYLTQIHPEIGPVRWPPPLQLWQDGENALAYRVSGGDKASPFGR